MSNEHGHNTDEKVKDRPEILPNPDLSIPDPAEAPSPERIPANEGGTA